MGKNANSTRQNGALWRKWERHEDALLGKHRDHEVAAKLKTTTATVAYRRKVLKIQAFERRPWTGSEQKLLGRAGDDAVARLLRRQLKLVTTRRRELGIARF